MLIRYPIAFLVGLFLFLFPFGVGDPEVLLLLAIGGAFFTIIGLVVVFLLGLPLLMTTLWERWCRIGWWTLLPLIIGILLMVISGLPFNNRTEFVPHLTIWWAGWLTVLFGVAHCPRLSLDRIRGQSLVLKRIRWPDSLRRLLDVIQ